jgi:thymidylate synthase
MQTDRTIVVNSLDEALAQTLKQLIEDGSKVAISDPLSTAAGRTTYEILNYSVRVTNPKRRFPGNPEVHFGAVAAVSRFVWMMSASDRASDIAFYQPRAATFSDDGLTIPGSSYGRRILSPRPGLNQLAGVIERLKQDPNTRRAFLSIYQPEDAVRTSRDIPCLLSLGYHIRDGRLHATTYMRANNAYSLFPYNFFEFSLLAEMIAAELGIEVGPFTHSVASMHIYEEDIDRSRAIVRGSSNTLESPTLELPSKPLAGVRGLIALEPLVRAVGHCGAHRLEEVRARADQQLAGVWRDMFQVLLIHGLLTSNNTLQAKNLIESIGGPWRRYLSLPA